MNETKQRHGCINAWLWLVIAANLAFCGYYAIQMFSVWSNTMVWGFGLLSILALGNVLGAILLMRWNKCGFYLFIVCSIITAIVNAGILGLGASSGIQGLVAILIWWGILHIKKDGVPAWKLMNGGWDYKHCRHLYQLFGIIAGGLLIATIAASTTNTNTAGISDEDYEDVVDTLAVEEVVEEITWKRFSDDGKYCSIEAPDDFRKSTISEDQILGLMCSDYDPAVFVLKESSSDVKAAGINSPKEYADVIVKMNQNVEGATNFKKISEKEYSANSYLIVYDMDMDGTKFRYNLLTTRTSSNFYYCMVYCLSEYSGKLKDTVNHMLDSFEANK